MKRRGGGGAGWRLDEEARRGLVGSSEGHATLTNKLHDGGLVQPIINTDVTELLRRDGSTIINGVVDLFRAQPDEVTTSFLKAFKQG